MLLLPYLIYCSVCIGTSKYQMPDALSPCTVLTHSHQICFRFHFSDCDRSFGMSWASENWVLLSLRCHVAYSTHSLSPSPARSPICLSMSLHLIYLLRSVLFYFFMGDENMVYVVCPLSCVCVSLLNRGCCGCREANAPEKKFHIIYILSARPDADPYDKG